MKQNFQFIELNSIEIERVIKSSELVFKKRAKKKIKKMKNSLRNRQLGTSIRAASKLATAAPTFHMNKQNFPKKRQQLSDIISDVFSSEDRDLINTAMIRSDKKQISISKLDIPQIVTNSELNMIVNTKKEETNPQKEVIFHNKKQTDIWDDAEDIISSRFLDDRFNSVSFSSRTPSTNVSQIHSRIASVEQSRGNTARAERARQSEIQKIQRESLKNNIQDEIEKKTRMNRFVINTTFQREPEKSTAYGNREVLIPRMSSGKKRLLHIMDQNSIALNESEELLERANNDETPITKEMQKKFTSGYFKNYLMEAGLPIPSVLKNVNYDEYNEFVRTHAVKNMLRGYPT